MKQEIWTIQKVLNWTIGYFQEKAVPEPRLSAELLLTHVLKCKRVDLYLQFERILSPEELGDYRKAIKRRAAGEPVQYITGEQEFMGLNFRVRKGCLIPRQDTELLVERALNIIRKNPENIHAVLDVGIGSGNISLSVAHYAPQVQVTGIDISEEALAIAEENREQLQITNAEFLLADGLTWQPGRKFDLLLSNPPYISREDYQTLHMQVREFEPSRALLAGEEGLDFYRQFVPHSKSLLKKGAYILLEVGYNQSRTVMQLLQDHGFSGILAHKDYNNIERLIEAKNE